MEDIITSIIFFTSLVLIVFILAKYNYLIKKTRMENGNPPSITGKNRYLEIGSIVLFIGIGMGLASYLPSSDLPEDTMYLLVNCIIFICGGLGLVAAYYIRRKGGH